MLKAAVDAGHRISDVSQLDEESLGRRVIEPSPAASAPLEETLEALRRLDGAGAEEILSTQLAALGPQRFVRRLAIPLLRRIGQEWSDNQLCVASEHLGTSLLRSILGTALKPSALHRDAPLVILATPPGEAHELGILIAALTVLGSGANVLYLGPDLPVDEMARAAETTRASVVAIGVIGVQPERNQSSVDELRASLPDEVEVWVGGLGWEKLNASKGVELVGDLDRLERLVERQLIRAIQTR